MISKLAIKDQNINKNISKKTTSMQVKKKKAPKKKKKKLKDSENH